MRRAHKLPASIAAGLALAAALAAGPAAAQRVEVGTAATVVGEVKLSNAAIRTPRAVQRREHLAWGDRIDTGKKSQMQILLLDRSTFGIGASSRVTIDRFVYDPNAGRSIWATLTEGALRFFSGRQEGTNTAEVQTPAGRIGIRGTALDLLVGEDAKEIATDEDFVERTDHPESDEDEATLVVLRGPGAGTAGGLAVGYAEVEAAGVKVVLDQPGLAAYIPRNGAPPIGPFLLSNGGLADLQDELAPEVARASEGNGLLGALIPAAIGAVALGALLSSGGDNDNRPTGRTPTTTQSSGNNPSRPNDPNKPR